jgi:N-acetylmuramoyl-L-alanine amidase
MERMTSLIRGPFRRKNALAAAALSLCTFIGMAAAPEDAYGGAPVPRYERSLPEADVLIDVGHGGVDGGAHHGELLEKDINLAVAKRLYLMLGHRGVSAIMNRTGDYALSDENRWHVSSSRHRKDLSQRRQLSQEIPVRIMVSIHVNWSSSSRANGPLVLHQREGRSALLAAFLQDAMNDAYSGISRSPKIGRPYFLLNNVHRPAVIIELGFISNPEDRLKLTDPRWQQRIATAIADGIRQYALVAE